MSSEVETSLKGCFQFVPKSQLAPICNTGLLINISDSRVYNNEQATYINSLLPSQNAHACELRSGTPQVQTCISFPNKNTSAVLQF